MCDLRNEPATAEKFRGWADKYVTAVEENAWDGKWYRRGYYDDGKPLGSHESSEGKIDAIAQSWAVISQGGDKKRAKIAMKSVLDHLVLPEDRLLLLFTPPFDKTEQNPGYIKGYLPGIRENGAQYTHAATWTALAFCELRDGNRSGQLFNLLNPCTKQIRQKKQKPTEWSRMLSLPISTVRSPTFAVEVGAGILDRPPGSIVSGLREY